MAYCRDPNTLSSLLPGGRSRTCSGPIAERPGGNKAPPYGGPASIVAGSDGPSMEAQLASSVTETGDGCEEMDGTSILETVANEYCQRILLLLSSHHGGLTAQEISDRTDCPLSTTYRKLRELEGVGLIAKRFAIRTKGKPTGRYTVDTNELCIRFTDGQLEIERR